LSFKQYFTPRRWADIPRNEYSCWKSEDAPGIAGTFLLRVGREHAAEKQLAERFPVDFLGRLTADEPGAVVGPLSHEQYELARSLADLTYQVSCRSPGREFRKEAYDQRAEVHQRCEAWQAVQDAVARLETDPGDAEANGLVGRWYCLEKADWDKGLPHLARCDDRELATLARRELESPPGTWSKQVELGDAWWDLAGKAEGQAKNRLRARARHWYRRARPQVTEMLVASKLDNRLEPLSNAAPSQWPPRQHPADEW
jgi:hypothetical protein